MVSVFDLDKLYGLLQDFHRITRIRITVFDPDLRELVSYPEEVSPACQVIRSCPAGIDACTRCDLEACAQAARQRETHIYRCHAGLTEAVTPLYVGGTLAGYLLFGHVFAYDTHAAGTAAVLDACRGLPVDRARLAAACLQLPLIHRDYVASATQILQAVASYLVLERMATLQEGHLAARVDTYLAANLEKELTAEDLCREFGIGRTRLYKLSSELYGQGIAQHIRGLRMERAKALLLNRREMAIAEVASRCGYRDYNYFISVFSREVGCPPGAYRNRRGADANSR